MKPLLEGKIKGENVFCWVETLSQMTVLTQTHKDQKPVFRQKVCDKPCPVLVGLWPVSQVAGHHPDHSDDDDDGDHDDDDHDDHDDDFDDDYLCLSARVMYQSKTAVSGKTCRPQKCFLTII